MDTPQRGYTLIKHNKDALYDMTIYDEGIAVDTIRNITLQRAVVIIEDSTYATSYRV